MRLLAATLLGVVGAIALLFSASDARAEAAGWICDLHWRLADSPLSPLRPLRRGARIAEYRWYVQNCSKDKERLAKALAQIADYQYSQRKGQKTTQQNLVTPRPMPPTPAGPPLPPPVPAPSAGVSKDVAIVDGDGGGDVRTIGEALPLVREGGTIRIHTGHYREDVRIMKSVRIIGDRESPPTLAGTVVSGGMDVTLESLKLEGRHQDGTLRIEGGALRLVNSQVENNGGVAMDSLLTPAISVTGGLLELEGGLIGPGRDAAILVMATGRLSIRDEGNVRGDTGYGVYGTGDSQLDISHSKLSGTIAVVTSGRANLLLADTELVGTRGKPVVSLAGQTVAEVLNNKVEIAIAGGTRIPADRDWIQVTRSVSHRIEGNTTTKGKRLAAPRPQGVGFDNEVGSNSNPSRRHRPAVRNTPSAH